MTQRQLLAAATVVVVLAGMVIGSLISISSRFADGCHHEEQRIHGGHRDRGAVVE